MRRLVRGLERSAEASTHSASDTSGWGHQLLDKEKALCSAASTMLLNSMCTLSSHPWDAAQEH